MEFLAFLESVGLLLTVCLALTVVGGAGVLGLARLEAASVHTPATEQDQPNSRL